MKDIECEVVIVIKLQLTCSGNIVIMTKITNRRDHFDLMEHLFPGCSYVSHISVQLYEGCFSFNQRHRKCAIFGKSSI